MNSNGLRLRRGSVLTDLCRIGTSGTVRDISVLSPTVNMRQLSTTLSCSRRSTPSNIQRLSANKFQQRHYSNSIRATKTIISRSSNMQQYIIVRRNMSAKPSPSSTSSSTAVTAISVDKELQDSYTGILPRMYSLQV